MNEGKEKETERGKEMEGKKPFSFEKLMGSPYIWTAASSCQELSSLFPRIELVIFLGCHINETLHMVSFWL
jgi:hypothetical protein